MAATWAATWEAAVTQNIYTKLVTVIYRLYIIYNAGQMQGSAGNMMEAPDVGGPSAAKIPPVRAPGRPSGGRSSRRSGGPPPMTLAQQSAGIFYF